MQLFNLSATLNISRLLYNPSLIIPHITIKSFDQLQIPIQIGSNNIKIKAIVLDKDNCISIDHDDKLFPPYQEKFNQLKSTYEHILIVSNSAGTNDDIDLKQAKILKENLGIEVLIHPTKKPGCGNEILEYFKQYNIQPEEILIIGDRTSTDIMMGNLMGSYTCWVSNGVELSSKLLPTWERKINEKLINWGYKPLNPNESSK